MAERFPGFRAITEILTGTLFYSVASLWDIAIKMRLGKLMPRLPLLDIPLLLDAIGFTLLGIDVARVLQTSDPEPPTRDPFDGLLLAQCHVEGLKLITVDRAIVGHPLAFRL